jgi:hypothetical protein
MSSQYMSLVADLGNEYRALMAQPASPERNQRMQEIQNELEAMSPETDPQECRV